MPRKGSKKYVYPYEKYKDSQNRYRKTSIKELRLAYTVEVYESIVKPAIDATGMKTATFIKSAVREKIERDGLMPEGTTWPDFMNAPTDDSEDASEN